MPKKRIKTVDKSIKKEPYLKLNPNAAGLTLGTVSFVFGIMIIIAFNAVGDASGSELKLNVLSNIVLFMLSAFIEGTIIGYIVAWMYNKFVYVAK